MIAGGSLELALARVHARLARRPSPAGWARLESLRDAGAFLDAARAAWPDIAGLGVTPDTPTHAIEQRILDRWRALVGEVASWLPPEWGFALEWLALLPRLGALVHLARGRDPREWMRDDPALASRLAIAAASGMRPSRDHAGDEAPRDGIPRDGTFAGLAVPRLARAAWVAEWRRRVPAGDEEQARALALLQTVVVRHLETFARTSGAASGWLARRELEARLLACLRRTESTAVPALAFLGVAMLDLERLRGEVLRRVLFSARAA